jgi:hypothetical protein
VQRRRVTRRGAGGRLPRRAATTRDKTGRGETQTQPVAVSTARLLTVVIRVQILQHCVRQSTQASRSQPVPATAASALVSSSCWPAPPRHACPRRPTSRSVSDCTRTHTAVVRDCSQHYTPVSAVPPYEASEECGLPIERATNNGRAIQTLSPAPSKPNAAAAHDGATSGRGQWAGR